MINQLRFVTSCFLLFILFKTFFHNGFIKSVKKLENNKIILSYFYQELSLFGQIAHLQKIIKKKYSSNDQFPLYIYFRVKN